MFSSVTKILSTAETKYETQVMGYERVSRLASDPGVLCINAAQDDISHVTPWVELARQSVTIKLTRFSGGFEIFLVLCLHGFIHSY